MTDSTTTPSILVRVLAFAAVVAGLAGFATPLLVSTDPDERSMWLVEAIPGFATMGGGPYSTEALLASIAIGVFAVVLAATAVLSVAFAARPGSRGLRRVLHVAAIVLLVGCGGAALLVVILSGQFGGRALPVSPAVFLAAVGGVLALVATRLRASA